MSTAKEALILHYKAKLMRISQTGTDLYVEEEDIELFVEEALAFVKRACLFMNDMAGPTDKEILDVSLIFPLTLFTC